MPPVAVISPAPLRGTHGQLVEALGTDIAAGVLPPGARIVPESVTQAYSVSRTVVREVFKVLEAKGMVSARQRTGTVVRPASDWDVLDPDVIRWRSSGPESRRQISELLAIRGAIEPLAAREAVANASAADLAALDETITALTEAVASEDWKGFAEADVRFHRALLLSSGSRVIGRLVSPICAALDVRHRLSLVPQTPGSEAVDSHQRVVDAIRADDPDAAERASRLIINVAESEITEILRQRDSPRSKT
jgi:GntR family galactonate operon transcriptional repressor